MTVWTSDAECAERPGTHSRQDIVAKDIVYPETVDPTRRRT